MDKHIKKECLRTQETHGAENSSNASKEINLEELGSKSLAHNSMDKNVKSPAQAPLVTGPHLPQCLYNQQLLRIKTVKNLSESERLR